ncbi:MAG: glutathione-disulfide reductase [Oceanospirillaceae bacterium]|nr:glutathione-disulfide reductase [Oceanospirillaceae bacterium]|tara:strand:+ start:1954 stop:3315 length:1362 start_codon:yes stop_codon:yes gene_type:complete
MSDKYDLVVIGAGSGGVRAARMAAATGARVAVLENRYLGGTCVNVGCVPKKLFVYASEFSHAFHDASGFGHTVPQTHFDWPTLKTNKDNEINRLNGIYNNLLDGSGVEIIHASGHIASADTVIAGDRRLTTERILIATGGWPNMPDFPGSEHCINSNDVFALEHFPASVVVIGGGYIATEFAGIFHGLGADTTLNYRGDLILRGFDREVREYITAQMTASGIHFLCNTDISSVELLPDGRRRCHFSDGSSRDADTVLCATGRNPNTEGLGLQALGVQLRKDGSIVADDHFATSVPGIWALGDVIGTPALTPVAIEQAMCFVNQQFGDDSRLMDYDQIPTAIFTQPPIGTLGLSEEDACEQYPQDIDIYRSEFRALKHTLSGSAERTLMKLVVRRSDDRVLGVHMVSEAAGEIIQSLAVAVRMGATKADFDRTLPVHPTAAEEFVTMRSPSRSY